MSFIEDKHYEKRVINPGSLPAIRFNVMVVGPTGSGKTTFLMTLFKSYVSDINSIVTYNNVDFNNTTTKTVRIERIGAFKLNAEAIACEISLYDSVGFGDSINNDDAIELVRAHLSKAHEEWLSFSGNGMTEADRNMKDNRVHCLFYFIAPHRVKDIDAEFLKQLSGMAPIVPVIAKADTMTLSERTIHLSNVRDCLDRIRKDLGSDKNINFLFESDQDFEDYINAENVQVLSPELNNVIETADESEKANANELLEGKEETEVKENGTIYDSSDAVSSAENRTVESNDSQEYEMLDAQYNHSIVPVVEASYNINGDYEETQLQQPVEHNPGEQYTAPSLAEAFTRLPNIYAVICDYGDTGMRQYPWGDLFIYYEGHSDFRRLQRLVFEESNISKLREECQLLSMKYQHDNVKLIASNNANKETINVTKLLIGAMTIINSYFILIGWTVLLLFLIGFFVSRGNMSILYHHCKTILAIITKVQQYLPTPVTVAILASIFTVELSNNTKCSHNDVLLWCGKHYNKSMKYT